MNASDPHQESDDGGIRLQEYMADAGLCSRRSAEALIYQGEVWVNGKRAVLGQKVHAGVDRVTVSGKPVGGAAQPKVTLVVNKPRGLVCSNDDPFNPETIFSLVPRPLRRLRFFCAGRLDKDSEGLVILTTDGDLANRLMHPSSGVIKRYHVTIKRPFPSEKLPRLVKGLTFEGERLKVERASIINPARDDTGTSLDVHMHHGKKREIRLLFAALGFPVTRLRRYQIGSMRVKGIPLRGARQIDSREIEGLFRSPRTPNADVQADAHKEFQRHED